MRRFTKILNFLLVWSLILGLVKLSYARSVDIIPDAKLAVKVDKIKKNSTPEVLLTLTKKQIKKSPQLTFAGLLQNQSIVRIGKSSGNAHATAVSFRGFGDNAAQNSLVLMDGFPFINNSLLPPDLNQINPLDIKEIQIFQGSEGSLWGNQAVGGIINIITDIPQKFSGQVNLGFGSFDQLLQNIYLANCFNNGIYFKFSGTENVNDNQRQHNEQRFQQVFNQWGYNYSSGTIWFKYFDFTNHDQLAGPLTEEQYDTNPWQTTTPQNQMEDHTQIYQFFNQQELTSNWLLETRLYHHNVESNGYIYDSFQSEDSITGLNPQLKGKLGNIQLLLGDSLLDSRYTIFEETSQKTAALENDIYGQAKIPLAQRWQVVLGARYAKQDNDIKTPSLLPNQFTQQTFVSEQGLYFYPKDHLKLYIRRDGNFRFPKPDEILWSQTNTQVLQPQIGVSYELGGQWKTLKNLFQWNFYHLILNNEIAFDPTMTPENPFGSYQNFLKTIRNGFVLSNIYQVSHDLDLRGQFNYVDARFATGPYSGNKVPAVPNLLANIGFGYAINKNLKFIYTALYNSDQFASNDANNTSSKVPGYWLNNASLEYNLKKVSVNLIVNNIFNQKYSVFTVWNQFSSANIYYPGMGRNFLVSIKISMD